MLEGVTEKREKRKKKEKEEKKEAKEEKGEGGETGVRTKFQRELPRPMPTKILLRVRSKEPYIEVYYQRRW